MAADLRNVTREWHLVIITALVLFIVLDNATRNSRSSCIQLWGAAEEPALASSIRASIPLSDDQNKAQKRGPAVVKDEDDERVRLLLDLWTKSLDTHAPVAPRAPHLLNCKTCSSSYSKLDSRDPNGDRPRWSIWKGLLGVELGADVNVPVEDQSEERLGSKATTQGPYPPWVQGADEDNAPMTRRAQRDIWLNQHPRNCSEAKFLVAEWGSVVMPGDYGMGAELVGMAGALAFALQERRVLVTKDYPAANHSGCTGRNRARWSCYFAPEAPQECIDRALHLATQESAWKGDVIKRENFSGIWRDMPIPDWWGTPWESTQKTVEIDGHLLLDYKLENRRWYRAQAFRYLMRYPSEYLCNLLNRARHKAFGKQAAKLVATSLPAGWPRVEFKPRNQTDMEKLVWVTSGPWMPRPLVSLHVRQGDKAKEMELFDLKSYMQLCEYLRGAFPHVKDIWLATEMQNVIDESKKYSGWNFHYTRIARQTGNTSMTEYMASLGEKNNSDNSYVNLWMASEADFFVGALGSTWSCVIDGLRLTSGKVMAGFLSVNSINRFLR